MDLVRCRQYGFTLIEVIVAIGIFSVLSIGCYKITNGIINAKEKIYSHSDGIHKISRAVRIIESDFLQVIDRKILDENGIRLSSYLTNFTDHENKKIDVEFSRSGYRNPLLAKRSEIARVSYGFQDSLDKNELEEFNLLDSSSMESKNNGYLIRYVWPVLDRGRNVEPERQLLLDGISSFTIEYYDANGEWGSIWPSLGSSGQKISEIPYAIKVKIGKDENFLIERLFVLRRLP